MACNNLRITIVLFLFQLIGGQLSVPSSVVVNQNRRTGHLLATLDCTSTQPAEYHILAVSPNVSFLALDSTSGELRLAEDGVQLNPATYSVSLDCTYASGSESATFSVERVDENEFPPVFADSGPVISIAETVDISTVVRQVAATDQDVGSYGTITYSITTPGIESTFDIHSSTGVITLLMSLDFEQRSRYQFEVVASNGPSDSGEVISSTVLVIVNVVDVDDTSPVFTNSSYSRSLPENNPMAVDVLTFVCTDLDTISSSIRYGFSGEGHGPFQLHPITGDLSVPAFRLDYETTTLYSFTVTCYDNSLLNNSENALVDISVLPVNEHIPSVLTRTLLASINEATPTGTVLATTLNTTSDMFRLYSARDNDAGPDGNVMYTLVSNDGAELLREHLSIDINTGELVLILQLDFDDANSPVSRTTLNPAARFVRVDIRITACDVFPPPFDRECPNVLLNLFLVPRNEFPPEFSQAEYNVSVSESVGFNTVVHRVSCTDRDLVFGQFSAIDFDIASQNILDDFVIDHVTGEIRVRVALDYETTTNYGFHLRCNDTEGLEDSAFVAIQVTPVNDNRPSFGRSNYQFNVSRTTPANRFPVGRVSATDLDDGFGGNLIYSEQPNPYFRIASDGVVLLVNSVQNVSGTEVHFDAIVHDGPNDTFNEARAFVVVTFTQGNRQRPVFMQGSRGVDISELLSIGSFVTTVQCMDNETGLNGVIRYSIQDGNADSMFAIDAITGAITVAAVLTLPQNVLEELHFLQVVCEDRGVPRESNQATILVRVTQDDSSPPVISENAIFHFVEENTTMNTRILQVNATDLDTDSLVFRLENESHPGVFIIDPPSGVVILAAPLDRETVSSYTMTVVVTERRTIPGPERSDSALLTILIRDVNDNTPVCEQNSLLVTVPDTIVPGDPVLSLNCTDLDIGVNGNLTYSLAENFGVLAVNSMGVIYLNESLELESRNILVFVVVVSDRGFPTPSANSYHVTVRISSTNRNMPRLLNLPNSLSVPESATLQTTIFMVAAEDPDRGSFGQLTYRIVSSSDSSNFDIIPNTGSILLGSMLNFFQQQTHTLNISVEDTNFVIYGTLVVSVTDVNDFSPVCDETTITSTIAEGLPANQILSPRLSCSDGDQGPNGELSFAISLGNDGNAFGLSNNGVLMLLETLDFEQVQRYSLQVNISDGGTPPQRVVATVTVVVQAVNEFAPIFREPSYSESIPENSSVVMSILTVGATDDDLSTHQDGQVAYSISGPDSSLFTISRSSGLLQVAGDLDREDQEVFVFTVTASDQGIPPRAARSVINITLTDIDDNPPVFATMFYRVTHDQQDADSVLTVACSDPDMGTNAAVAYSLDTRSRDAQFFQVSDAGVIRVDGALVISRTYSFGVICSGPPPAKRSDTAVVIIQAVVNTTISFVPSSTYNRTLNEDTEPVYDVLTISAFSSTNASLTYSLLTDSAVFRLDSSTGILRLVTTLDYEVDQSFALRVQASDSGSPPNLAEALVDILVGNVNDEVPVISTVPPVLNRTEGPTSATEVLLDLECSDGDDGTFGSVSFRIERGNELGLFSVSLSGTLSLVGDLDYEIAAFFTLDIVCEDSGSPVLSNTVSLSVNVIPVNDNPPMFEQMVYSIGVQESVLVNSRLGVIVAVDADLPPHGDVRYSLVSESTGPAMFEISPTSGELTLLRPLDYEGVRTYSFVVLAEDSAGREVPDFPVLNDTATVVINVLDVNDNTPVLSRSAYSGSIVEEAGAGAEVVLANNITCSDADSDENGAFSFSVTGSVFQIHPNSGIVTAAENLNFETRSSYSLSIACVDDGTPALSSVASLLITVTDVNEFNPRFTNESGYIFNVLESQIVGEVIGVIQATDEDAGEAGIVSYSFINSTQPLFSLDSGTGAITLLGGLDFETQHHQYILQAIARDNAGNSNEATIIINVQDVDDNSPAFTANVYFLSIRENVPRDSTVGRVTCMDLDNAALNVSVSYTISSLTFAIDSQSGVITTVEGLDLEVIPRYSIRVVCTDAASNDAFANVTITLLPFNDFTPTFIRSSFNASITENAPSGTSVLQLRASDDDINEYSAITYSIVRGNDGGLFSLGPFDGVLRVSQIVDRETISSHILQVQARNVIPPTDTSGSSPLSSLATVFVEVLDVNDNSPTISPSDPAPVFITEADGPSAFVLQLSCLDLDAGLNGTTSFSITSPERFRITESGALTTITLIRTNEVVSVTCSDAGTPPLSSSVDISVSTISVNDHPPMFDSASYSVRVREDTAIGEIVTCINATDRDGMDTPDGIVEYSLHFTGSGVSKFRVVESAGCIFVSIALDFDVTMLFEYTLVATDLGVRALQGNTSLVIEIVDAIRDPPRFLDDSYRRTIPESAAVGSFIATIRCADPDVNDTTTYSLVDTPPEFTVDPTNGRLTTVTSLDFEVTQLYVLGVRCTDSFGLEDMAQVSVTVVPINDYPPTFFSDVADIEENSIIGREVTTLVWIDNDRGLDGEVTFSITAGNTNDAFSVTSSGTVLVKGNLDRESVPVYHLNVTITDRSISEPRSTVGQLNVTIIDVNDNRPQFTQDPYMFGPLEANETLHYSVGSVSCSDNDTGINAQTSFLISPDNVNFTLFAVDSAAGEITVGGDLRHRELDTVTFTVLCVDSGFPPLASSARVLVRVEEINRHAPEFLNSSYHIRVPEDTEILSVVILTVHAVDRDTGINGEVRYHLVDTFDGRFFLDERTGDLSLIRPLDFEQESSYSLIAVARDGAVDSILRLRSTVVIALQVVAVNEHIPACRNAIYVDVVNASSHGSILDFSCTDDDVGPDGQLRYTITRGNEDRYFEVSDGNLHVLTPFRPTDGTEQFSLRVLVEDLGIPSRSVAIDAIIIYSFDNVAAPEFSQASYTFDVDELTEVGTVVGVLRATDPDPSIQGLITYSVITSDHFRIDAESGELFVASPLDWESSPFLSFTVVAVDGDLLNPLQDVATVSVRVGNDNDNPPQCDRNLYISQIPSNASTGTTVVTLNCTDLDRDVLRYTIASEASVYNIDPNTGRVFVAGALTEPTYLVTVEVSDNGGQRIETFVSIATLFINLEPPSFDDPKYVFSVSEQAPLLTVVGSAQASDIDSNLIDLTYSLVDAGFGEFYVNPSTGELVLTVPLDFETTQTYTLIVQVTDAGGFDGSNMLSSSVMVTVNVDNNNDNQPIFSDGGIYGRTVLETTPVGTSILTISCTDEDLAPFGTPAITSDAFNGIPFSLRDETNGEAEVIVSGLLTGPRAYFVNITCRDSGNQEVEGQVFLFVPEPNAPSFSEPVYEWFVSELSVAGTAYTSVEATSNDDSEIAFTIADGNNDDIFHVDRSSGVISLVVSLDYETQRRHGLIVRAVDEANRESNVLLLVQVIDANDEVPLIPPSALLGITQNQVPGYPVGSVECVDADANINSTIFSYTFSPPSSQFSIDEFGVIRLESLLGSTPAYVIPVVCFDIRDPTTNTTGIVTIQVDFVNLHEPEFAFPLYAFRVPEDLEVLSPVGSPVTATDNDIGSFSELMFVIDGEQDHFYIESETGRIGLLTSLDREVQDLYVVSVIATDGGPSAVDSSRMTGSTTVMVTVDDTNDNAPVPSQQSYVQVINTNHTIRSPVLSTPCSDPDVGSNGTVTYSIMPSSGSDNFIIQSNGTILLAQEQPNQAVYSFFVVCTDRGSPPLNSSALVTVTVNFLALSAPVFSEDHYNASILENTTVTTAVHRVRATPSDASITVVYSLAGGNERERFFIDSVTGVISVRNPLDAREEQHYTLVVRAGNEGSDQLFSLATVSVSIEDINDNSPRFLSQFYTGTVAENSALLTPVASVVCVDTDVSSDISYSITGGLSDPPAFNITQGGQMAVAGGINYESTLLYSLEVTCSDGGSPPRTTVATVRLTVSPVNEFPPGFSRREYTFDATENNFGAMIGSIEATDGDTGIHGSITYLLQDPGNFSVIFVDPTTGDVSVSNNLDYEFQPFWNLTVIARDGGGLESSVPLNIQILNVNDALPSLVPEASTIGIPVDREAGFPVQAYVCTDADGSDTSVSIASGNSLGYFELNLANNILYWTGRASNLLSNSVISLTLTCVDTNAPDQVDVSIIAVSVVVTDAVPPIYSEPVYSASVPEDTEVNTTVLTVLAVAENAVNYSIPSLPSGFPFTVSTLEGNISLVRSLNREQEDRYTFFVSATDATTGAIALVQVEISIADVNDNPPVIFPPTQVLRLTENFVIFSVPLIGFTCTDTDTGLNSDITFAVTNGNAEEMFIIDNTGHIYLAQPLDFESITNFTLEITCLDSMTSPLSDTATLFVSVTGFNEYPPVFSNSTYSFSVSELAFVGDRIGRVMATDDDAGLDGLITYTILTGSDRFIVLGSSGELFLAREVDFEALSRYDLVVEARDGTEDTTLQLASTVVVVIEVTRANEHFPMCRNAIYVGIVNGTTQGRVVEFFCTDADEGRDGQLTYDILSGNGEGYFVAQDDSLVVPVPFRPTDGTEEFMLHVLVEDLGMPPRSTIIEVLIIYSFDNLAAPEFSQASYTFDVDELTEVGTVVGVLRATDPDPSIQGQITYSVINSDHFRIDAESGELFVASPLDWESSPFLSFNLIAVDGDRMNPLQDVATVSVRVGNDNDNPPQCDRNLYISQIPSNASIGTPVVTLNCTDLDQNPLRYTILSETSAYSVDSNFGRIFVSGPLQDPTSLLTLRVSGDDNESISVSVSITLLFTNQAPPMFSSPDYVFSVSESASILTSVGFILATDADSGVGALSYSSTGTGVEEFYVNPSTGDIILSVPLDYETVRQYRFDVQVMDTGSFDGSNILASTASVTVNVNNSNDNQPTFRGGGIYGSTIPEITAVGTSLLSISCTDGDDAPFSSPSITSQDFGESVPFELVTLAPGEAEVRVSMSLSGEATYLVNVTCTDGGGERTPGLVLIFIPEPLAPVFNQPGYQWFVSELALVGTSFTDVQASSNDGSAITYSITDGNEDGVFYIDPSSGEVSLILSLDYEAQTQHGLVMRAVDGDTRQSIVVLLVQVQNANDEVPLVPPSVLLSITQNQVPGYPVGLVECVDADANINSITFNYTFSPPSSQFSIDEFGIIRLESLLGSTPAYVIPVVCFDIRDPTINTTGIVTIQVDFVNLHEPEFAFPLYAFRVPEDLEVLSPVGSPVTATDNDIGSFSELMFVIDGEQDQFYIESETGRIGLLTSLDREVQDLYVVSVIATDGGPSAVDSSRMTGSTTVMVTVDDTNDNAPVPSQQSYVQVINTNHTIRSPVLSTPCSDPDVGSNGTVTYSLMPSSGSDNFIIQSNGTILLAQEQPNQAVYSFFVVCTDRGSPPLNSSALVTVTVNFLALSAPVFSEDHYNTSILENTTVTTAVQRVRATPSDASITVVYSLAGGNERERFFIDSVTGVISVRNPLDAREEQYYTLVVRAGNEGSDQLFSLATAFVFVEDINDNSPRFLSQFYTGTVAENSALLTPVASVVCLDTDVSSDVSYSITGGLSDPPAFSVNEVGQIAVAGLIDYELSTGYSLQITCSDGGSPPRTAVATVRVTVSPVNEFPPSFSRREYTFDATENDFGAMIGSIEATDGDTGIHGSITYLLQDPGNFSVIFVDPIAGNIAVSNNLDYEFQPFWNLTAIARDGGGLESSVSLNIEVLNVNDVPPVLDPQAAVHNITFDEEANTILQPYLCSDADGSTTTLTIANGNAEGYFELDGNVVVWTGRAGNLTANIVTAFTVHCQDDGAPDQFDDGIIAVSIVVMDAIPPAFSDPVYSALVPENTPINSTLLIVLAVGENEVSYSLPNLLSSFPFGISPVDGRIILLQLLNRESEDSYSFFVLATDRITGAMGVSRVSISLLDINDNAPVITPHFQAIRIPENHPLSTSFVQFACTDVDTGSNGEVRFRVTGGNATNTFAISGNGLVSLAQPLDFESLTNYTLEITCRDSAESPQSDTAILNIVVDGVNEYAPVFTNSTYQFSISEYARTGDLVGVVSAADLDDGLDGEVEYSILFGTGMDFFTLRQTGSIVTSIQPLNATTHPVLELIIRATDGRQMHSDALVIVTVLDVNEPPRFSDSGNYFVRESTDLSPGDTVLQFTCFDVDTAGRNSALDLVISTPEVALDLFLETNERASALDADLVTNSTVPAGAYTLLVTCTDRGNPPISSTTSITLRVDTLNTPPRFVGDVSEIYVISEDAQAGTFLFAVNATDTETAVTYSITGGTGLGSFQIDSTNGSVRTFLSLNYETTPAYSLEITTTDLSALDQMSATLVTSISVRNVNDIDPRLSPERRVVGLQEDASPSSAPPLEEYTCFDPDGSDTTITISSTDAFSPFAISRSGVVTLEAPVDYEVLTNHTVIVTCTDQEVRNGEGTTRQTTSSLIVNVIPVNIHAPVFTSQSTFAVPESAGIGYIVGTIEASDSDGRGRLTISSSSSRDTFHVDPSGNITVVSGLDYETRAEYTLSVVASDNDDAPLVEARTNSSQVVIVVSDENDNPPICAPNVLSTVFETGTYGNPSLLLAQLNCSDRDSGLNSLLQYSFVQGSLPSLAQGSFLLNGTSGELRFQGTVEVSGSHVLQILVEDSGRPALPTRVTIVVQVETANDTRPRFNQTVFRMSISERILSDTVVVSGQRITDSFINPLGDRVVFSLQASVDNDGAFIIDSGSADITVSNGELIDYEARSLYTLTIQAAINFVVETAVAEIRVLDFNDNAPCFPRSIYTGSVSENQLPGTFILTVQASDLDSEENRLIQYSIQGGSVGLDVDPDNGTITTALRLDREARDRYTVVVLATDMGVLPLTGSTTVTVSVTDLNDQPPVFSDAVYIVSIDDTIQPGDVVVTLRVEDKDEVGDLSFTIDDQEASGVFVVDSSGVLRLRTVGFPGTHSSPYNFTVVVSDGIAMDRARVLIHIVSLTTPTVLFEENVEMQYYDVREFLVQNFRVTVEATYSILGGDPFNEFEIGSDGLLRVSGTLDRENTSRYDLMIRVIDDTTAVDIELVVTVMVQDQNDNSPVFSSKVYIFNVSEGPYEDDTRFGALSATDLDQPDTSASTIEYSLLSESDEFAIDPSSGELFLKAGTVLDREKVENYTISVQARDHGEPAPLFSATKLVVILEDINDNDPEFVPLAVQEYLVLLPSDEVPPNTRLDKIVALLPFDTRQEITMISVTDPDPSSSVFASLEGGTGKPKFGFTNPNSMELELVTLDVVGKEDLGTVLELVLSDEPEEERPVIRNITFVGAGDFFVTTEKLSPDGSLSFFQTAVGIAVIVVICTLIIVIALSTCGLLCYIRSRRDKDPLKDTFRTTTIAQRILDDANRKSKKKLGSNWDFHGHSDVHQLNFPDLSPEDYETDILYPPVVEREASFMGQGDYSTPDDEFGRPYIPRSGEDLARRFIPRPGDRFGEPFIPIPGDEFGEPLEDYGDQSTLNSPMMRSRTDPFGFQDTDTSLLSSLHGDLDDSLNSYGDSSSGYAMGPVLKAMLEQWSMGDDLLSKKKRRTRKTSREQQND